ncbi:MAG: hypothetical protein AVDCRST_MAG53-2023, partial [uncultured Solirubrobacteraceae bacterium]
GAHSRHAQGRTERVHAQRQHLPRRRGRQDRPRSPDRGHQVGGDRRRGSRRRSEQRDAERRPELTGGPQRPGRRQAAERQGSRRHPQVDQRQGAGVRPDHVPVERGDRRRLRQHARRGRAGDRRQVAARRLRPDRRRGRGGRRHDRADPERLRHQALQGHDGCAEGEGRRRGRARSTAADLL